MSAFEQTLKYPVMGVLGLALKEILRTIFKSLALALKVKSLAVALKVKSLALFASPCSWPCKLLHLLFFVTVTSFTAELQQCLCLPIIRLSLATIRASCEWVCCSAADRD